MVIAGIWSHGAAFDVYMDQIRPGRFPAAAQPDILRATQKVRVLAKHWPQVAVLQLQIPASVDQPLQYYGKEQAAQMRTLARADRQPAACCSATCWHLPEPAIQHTDGAVRATQDELYMHQLSDACLEATRRLLGPHRALMWIRYASPQPAHYLSS